MTKRMIRFIIELVSIALLIVLDQITKIWAVATLKGGNIIELIPGVLEFNYLENKGAAFGILQNRQTVFVIAGAIILFFLIFILFIMPQQKKYYAANVIFVLIAAGAIGNMIDRVRLNYVIDFIYFRLIDFPVFNVADMYVSVSTVVLCLLILFYYKEEDLAVFVPKKKDKTI
ncbi:MAG TPA: signal peptidase II [Lachnospiraceae bacterium]|nr:signal peptidase II [Lachnospiraceae bacterium]